jgi:GMP synthase (glutamine-hydrolysing)
MFLVVNNSIDGRGESARELRATLERITNEKVLMESYWDVALERIKRLNPSHIFLSGQGNPWTQYSQEKLAGVFEVIRAVPRPILGICGGHQQIAIAHGATVDIMKRLEPGEGYNGCFKEKGFGDVVHEGFGLFEGLPQSISVWHSHCDEVKNLPDGFVRVASNGVCAIQAMQHETKKIFSVQFHPEIFNEENPHGQRILENFLEL